MSGGALTLVAPVRVGAGTSPAQQRVPRTLVHVCACARESGCEGTDQSGRGVARGKLLPAVPSPVTLATAGRAWRLGLDDPGSGVCAARSRGRSAQEGSWNPQENQGHEADTPRVTEGGPEKQRCRTPQGGKVQASAGAGCATPRLELQSRVPPSTPQAHPRAFAPGVQGPPGSLHRNPFHPSGPPQGLCTCCSPFRLLLQPLFTTFTLTLSHNLKSHRTGPIPGDHTLPYRVALSSASHSGHFAFLQGLILSTSVSPSGHELQEPGCLLLSSLWLPSVEVHEMFTE